MCKRSRPPSVTSRGYAVLLGLLLTSILPASAQTVRGTVIDDESGVAVGAADVTVLGTDDRVLGRFQADENGRFVARLPDVGSYRLRATGMGYESCTSDVFALEPGQGAVAELRLQLGPVNTNG